MKSSGINYFLLVGNVAFETELFMTQYIKHQYRYSTYRPRPVHRRHRHYHHRRRRLGSAIIIITIIATALLLL